MPWWTSFGGCSDCCLVECCIEGALAVVRAGNEIAMCVPSSLHFRHLSALLVLIVSMLSAGCSRSVTPTITTSIAAASGRGTASPAVAAAPSAEQIAVAHVHTYALYQQAETACKAQHYKQAATLLQCLATLPALTANERAFVTQQEALCLKDAGLPAPSNASTAERKPSVRTTAIASDSIVATTDLNCGPRALLLVCRQLGIRTSVEELSKQAGTNAQGTSLEGLAIAAKAVGLKAEGVQVSREALPDQPLPAIAYVNGNHFVALLSLHGSGESGTATILDPNAAGEETISQERLLRLCSGYLLLLHK